MDMNIPVLADQQRTYLHHLCTDIKCHLEDLPRVMDDKKGSENSKLPT